MAIITFELFRNNVVTRNLSSYLAFIRKCFTTYTITKEMKLKA